MPDQPKIFPLGDNALTIDFGNEISLELNQRAIALASSLNSDRFPGLIEAVPAYSSVAVFFELVQVRNDAPRSLSAFESVRQHIVDRLGRAHSADATAARMIEIPVDFGREAALDIEFVAERIKGSREEVVDIFVSRSYRVYMLGFLPGFAYMGEVDERIASPRKPSPRLKVPKGSVGIAGRQTGIYPVESPGGWQIIGRTNVELFTRDGDTPCLLNPGDEVRFVAM